MVNIQRSYREASVQGSSPVQLVIRLYEQLIEDLRQVSMAIEENAIERRSKRIKHAILIVGHLQSPIDFVNGGKVARDLDTFYNALRQNLLQVQFFPSKHGIAQLITDLLAVRAAWMEVDRVENYHPAIAARAANPARLFHPDADDPDSDPNLRMVWRG